MTSNIYEQTLIHWTKLIESFLPKNTRFIPVDTQQRFCIYIRLPHEHNEEESSTSSRTIMLIFTNEAINDYIHNYEPGSHRKANIRLKEFVAAKLKEHMPGRDAYEKNQVPEYWFITTDILNR